MKVDPLGTEPMFDIPDLPARPRPKVTAKPGTVRWSKYRPKNTVKCDDCMAVLAQNHGCGPVALPARHRRSVGKDDRLLCDPHAQQWRERDHLPALKGA